MVNLEDSLYKPIPKTILDGIEKNSIRKMVEKSDFIVHSYFTFFRSRGKYGTSGYDEVVQSVEDKMLRYQNELEFRGVKYRL